MNDIEFLKESVTGDLVSFLMEDLSVTMTQALELLQPTRTLELVLNEDTGLYWESSAHVYEYLKEEPALQSPHLDFPAPGSASR